MDKEPALGAPPEALILASTSRYRAELMSRLGLHFTTEQVAVDESCHPGETALALARRLSVEKARAVTDHGGDFASIGSDQVAACDNRLLGKPGTAAAACEQLQFVSGKHVVFFTGLALWRPRLNLLAQRVAHTEVSMRPLSNAEIERYVERDQPFDCAGSFKWEALGISLFRATEGPDPTALQGLPLIALSELLRQQGFQVP
ncbi:MAG: Maf family protein [Luminiphilus sp.]